MKRRYSLLCLAQTISLYVLIPVSSVLAQIASDGTLPTNVTTPNNGDFTITGGSQVGGNLFHSFSEFSIPTNGSAFFDNASDVQNIISRVTGGSISNIDGLLKANGTANLFFLNPNGIIFGSNADLNIGGSFVATTANSVTFADGTAFSTTDSRTPPLLTVTAPIGLQFGDSVGSIVNRSQASPDGATNGIEGAVGLQVQPGKTLALVGGEVALEGGNLTAPGGRIEVGSVASNSLVNLDATNQPLTLSYQSVQNFQDVRLSQGATIDVSDLSPLMGTGDIGSGDVQVQGRSVTLTDGSQISSITLGSASAGTVSVTASESVELIGTSENGSISSNLNTLTFGDGNAGNLSITTGRLILRDGAAISTSSVVTPMQNPGSVQGRSGNLTINASESVEITGSSATGGFGGLITVETQTDGDAGNLEISTGRLILRDGAQVSAATTGGGQGGTLTVAASESVEVSGSLTGGDGQVTPSTLRASSQGAGSAGNLTIATGRLIVQDGAEVTVSGTETGTAGDLDVTANSIRLDNSGSLRAETEGGERGSIRLQSRDVRLRHGSAITTNATGSATGGNITIDTDTLVALEASKITANAVQGQGGNIQITGQDVFLSPDSKITASSQLGINGEVEINTPDIGIENGITQLEVSFVAPDQAIAGSCLARRNVEQGSFVVTGTGGLPDNPYNAIRGRYSMAGVQGLTPQARQPASSPSSNADYPLSPKETPTVPILNHWKLGDPIQEAQGMTVTKDGHIIVGTAPQLVAAAQAEDLVCHTSTQPRSG